MTNDLIVKCIEPDFASFAPDPGTNTDRKMVMFQVVNPGSTFFAYMPKTHPYEKGQTYTFRTVYGGRE